jgi:Fe-S cluster assembly iron-binding protein IscA
VFSTRLLLAAACLAACAGCRRVSAELPPDRPPAEPPAVIEEWATGPAAEWPQLVLTNDASFAGDRRLKGASAFLILDGQGRPLAATARHLLGPAGGIEPAVPVEQARQLLTSWTLHPRTQADKAVSLGGPVRAWGDVVLLEVKPGQAALAARPLRLRREAAKIGEKVYLVGCPYSEPGCRQNVYAGTVVETSRCPGSTDPRSFSFRFEPKVSLSGFSGAPVIDAAGAALGVLVSGSDEVGNAEDLTAIFTLKPSDGGIVLTERAAAKVKELSIDVRKQAKLKPGEKLWLRVSLKNGQTKLDLDPDAGKGDDWLGESNGVPVVCLRSDRDQLKGAVVDFHPPDTGFSVFVPRPYSRE